jgi:hypothetical protein
MLFRMCCYLTPSSHREGNTVSFKNMKVTLYLYTKYIDAEKKNEGKWLNIERDMRGNGLMIWPSLSQVHPQIHFRGYTVRVELNFS